MASKEDLLRAAVDEAIGAIPVIKDYGWPDQAELAVIDSVLSIRANYGNRTTTGVVPRVRAYAKDRGACNDLGRLATTPRDDVLAALDTVQRSSGRLKVDLIIEVAGALASIGVVHAADVKPGDPSQRQAWCGVHGLGEVTWEYFGMLLGRPGVKADVMIKRFVGTVVGGTVGSQEAGRLIKAVAASRNAKASDLDHAIWRYQRGQGSRT